MMHTNMELWRVCRVLDKIPEGMHCDGRTAARAFAKGSKQVKQGKLNSHVYKAVGVYIN